MGGGGVYRCSWRIVLSIAQRVHIGRLKRCCGVPFQAGAHLWRWPGGKAIRWFLYIAGRHESVDRVVSGRVNSGFGWRLHICRLCNKILIPSLVAFRLYLRGSDADREGRCTSNVTLRKIWNSFLGREVVEKWSTQIFVRTASGQITASHASSRSGLTPYVPNTCSVI